ncbi:hypothetical protein DV451_002086 [Geotrichum candidum]|uniref:CBS domain-containing protein n=1 Tax=Geotrichum candidum TaxID=1173061 RepID=A0A0J9XIZ3_GEOCN|nr:hypothetical protein DV451_002086 [Geotrichum candidum]KAF5108224.1 hypothetical protein DV453_002495 [Geotrichum candidum]KAF5114218.1 hypothetical protein DV454_003090 [Geotrichum candidum]KAF7500517.1 hypothetical protein DV113_001404 [Geotrichum candidum]CDO57430.1 Conserved hypothetical protein. Putative CBS domain-containing protein [Geotrichum candidum]
MSSRKSPTKRNSDFPGSPINGASASGGAGPGSATGDNLSATGSGTKSPVQDFPTDGRRRQAYRDEAIRRKINTSLSKRVNTDTGRSRASRRPPPGTVLSLKPSPPLTMKTTTTVYEAAQFMAAKRENCVLVIDDDDTVCGIFTAKDLAFRVVGSDLDSKAVTIDQIMTRNPMCAQTDTSATEALNLMVSKGFRHLPIMDENKDIAGVLDITKCYHEAMEKLERAYKSSRKLHDALEGVQFESGTSQAVQIINYVESLKKRMEGPDLSSVLDETTMPVFVNIKTNAYEAAILMKEKNTTAVLVTENNHITGIVTSKDIVLRVIAAGFNPKICSLVRVMTPQPDFATHTTTIQTALRKMHDGNYLNLPVMGDNSEIVGIVDVLTLTYATLEQINTMSTSDSEGPAWNKFWMSIDADDHESLNSDNRSEHSTKNEGSYISPPDVSQSELAEFNIDPELGPNDSISFTAVDNSASGIGGMGGAASTQLTEYDIPFPFKFKSPNGRIHRITVAPSDGLLVLRGEVRSKLKPDELEKLGLTDLAEDDDDQDIYGISYVDDEGDVVAITSDRDLVDAINMARSLGKTKVDIYIHHPDDHAEVQTKVSSTIVTTTRSRRPASTVGGTTAADSDYPDTDEEEAALKASRRRRAQQKKFDADDGFIPGVPNELILPGAIALLASAILVVFVFGSKSGHHR